MAPGPPGAIPFVRFDTFQFGGRTRCPEPMPESRTDAARDEVIDRLSWGLSALAIMVGVAIVGSHIESGARRWAAAAWQFALQVPGSPATWGSAVLIAGVAMAVGKWRKLRRVFHYGAMLAFAWFILLTGAAFLAFLDDPYVNPLAPITWGAFAFLYALLFKVSK